MAKRVGPRRGSRVQYAPFWPLCKKTQISHFGLFFQFLTLSIKKRFLVLFLNPLPFFLLNPRKPSRFCCPPPLSMVVGVTVTVENRPKSPEQRSKPPLIGSRLYSPQIATKSSRSSFENYDSHLR